MSLVHEEYEGVVELKIRSPGRSEVLLRISRLDSAGTLRAQARARAAKVAGAEVSRYEEASHECWRILASRGESVTFLFFIGKERDRFLISATAGGEDSEVARDVTEHTVRTFEFLGG